MLKMAVLAKQVPDTKNVVGDVIKDDGTLNRAALPAIFNPEDLNALELALQIKDRVGGHVTVFTMGLPKAANILRDALARGADEAVLLSDRKLAGSDTLATSIALAAAVRKIMPLEIVLCGRQAIDGDTAQTGPQVAQKLELPQVTYAEEIRDVSNHKLTVFRRLGRHAELIESPLPVMLTVTSDGPEPRPAQAKRLLKMRRARVRMEVEKEVKAKGGDVDAECKRLEAQGLLIPTWGVDDLGIDLSQIGLSGSPTKVKACASVVLRTGEYKKIEPTETGARQLIDELVHDHILG
jgi:electron transfer flavoprotein beta subunit